MKNEQVIYESPNAIPVNDDRFKKGDENNESNDKKTISPIQLLAAGVLVVFIFFLIKKYLDNEKANN